MHSPFSPFRAFDDDQGHPHQPACHWNPSSTSNVHLQGPSFFQVAGPSGYSGWGWTQTLGANTNYTQYNVNRGGHYTFWRLNNFNRFQ